MNNFNEFNISVSNGSYVVLSLSEEIYEVNVTSGRFSNTFLTISNMLLSFALFFNILMLHVCYKREHTFMNKLMAFDCLVSEDVNPGYTRIAYVSIQNMALQTNMILLSSK